MRKSLILRTTIFLSFFLFAIGLTACLQRSNDSIESIPPTRDSTTTMPKNIAIPSLTEPPMGMKSAVSATANPQSDDRANNYLFPSDIEDSEIIEVIQLALETRWSDSRQFGKKFFAYVLLQPLERTEGIITAYLYVKDRMFTVEYGQLMEKGGREMPLALILEKKVDGWRVDIKVPIAGNQWGSSIQKIFPEEVWPLLFHSPPIPYEKLDENIIQQAEAYFGLPFDAVNNSFPPTTPMPTSAIRILTFTPTSTVDLSTITLNVSGKTFVDDDHITIAVDLYPENISSFYKGFLSKGWRVFVFQRKADHHYPPQNAFILDEIKAAENKNEFYVTVTSDELQNQFANRRDLIYQIVDEKGAIAWQDDLYLSFNLSAISEKNIDRESVQKGVVVGKPNLMQEDIVPFTERQDGLIVIQEILGGFYELTYTFDFVAAAGITATTEMEALADQLTIELFPSQYNGQFSTENSIRLTGDVFSTAGTFYVYFPSDWLMEAHSDEQFLTLRISDPNGKVIKEDSFHFIPNGLNASINTIDQ